MSVFLWMTKINKFDASERVKNTDLTLNVKLFFYINFLLS